MKAPEETVKRELLPWLAPWAAGLLTFAVFFAASRNGFLGSWDDDSNFLRNTNYRGLGWHQLRWMFTTFHLGPYQPLSWLSYGLDYAAWGMNPFGYHLTSILLHAANAVLFYLLSLRLLAQGPASPADRLGALCAALLFSLHPLRVEAVAWISARGHILSTLFFLLALLSWLDALQSGGSRRRRAASWLFYLLALLSKATAICLPAVLVLMDVYPLARLPGDVRQWPSPRYRGVWREKLPFFLAAFAFAAIEAWARLQAHSLRTLSQAGLIERLAQAAFGLTYYLQKTLIPARLSADQIFGPWAVSRGPYLIAAASLAAVAAAFIAARKRWPAGLAAFACYGMILLPVIGIVKVGHETVAARYSYASCLSWALLGGAGLRNLARAAQAGGGGRKAFACAFCGAAALLAFFAFESRREIPQWRDSAALWRSVLRLEPMHPLARHQLGLALISRDQASEAALLWQEQLRLFPGDADARKALAELVSRTWPAPPAPAALCDAAAVDLLKRGELDRALWFFNKALKLDPGLVRAREHLGVALTRMGRYDEAIAHFQSALRLQPGNRAARADLRLAESLKGRER